MRRAHLFLGVFFSPLLLLFILTGWWQTVASDDERERDGGFVHELIKKLSSVHTDSHFPRAGAHLVTWPGKALIVAMCVALIFSILLGLVLAWQAMRSKWLVVAAFGLGLVVPAVILYFA